jgi:hypothetical protein
MSKINFTQKSLKLDGFCGKSKTWGVPFIKFFQKTVIVGGVSL